MDDDDVVFDAKGSEDLGDSEEEIEANEARADTKIQKLRKELEQAKKEKQENLDGWQRAKADYVNALRRFEEERKNGVETGKLKAIEAFLPVMDSLERAKAHGELPEQFVGIVKQLESASASLGLTQFGAVGEHFDLMQHEALGQDPAASAEEDDIVTAVLEQGWKLGDNVIRPAKVRVAHFEG